MRLRQRSLIRSLFVRVLVVFLCILTVASILVHETARSRIDKAYDAQLIVATDVLMM